MILARWAGEAPNSGYEVKDSGHDDGTFEIIGMVPKNWTRISGEKFKAVLSKGALVHINP